MKKTLKEGIGYLSYAAAPYVVGKSFLDKNFRASLPERKGGGAWQSLPITPGNTVWLHGASVGEIGGVVPVLQALQRERSEYSYLVTTTSTTGQEEVKRRAPGVPHALFPLDFPNIVRRTLDQVQPRLVIIAETELWPNFLMELKRRRIPVLLINGRISDYSFPAYTRLRYIFRPLLNAYAKILVQTHIDGERFVSLGAPRENVIVAGSTKYSATVNSPALPLGRKEIAEKFHLQSDLPCFVAGSVRPGEEESVLDALRQIRLEFPRLQCIFAPRHLDRVEPVLAMLKERGLPFRRRTSGVPKRDDEILVLDSHGELKELYSLATIAFVGGSMVDIGGHNPLEPAAFGVPILFGPFDRNVRDAVAQLRQAGAISTVRNKDELAAATLKLLNNETALLQQGEAAKRVAEQNSRALETVLPVLLRHLPPKYLRAVGNGQ